MLDDSLTINLNHKFWYSISGISKPATHAGHGYDNFHNELKKIYRSFHLPGSSALSFATTASTLASLPVAGASCS